MKTKQLLRLTASLYNKPHLITQSSFESIAQYLDSRNHSLMKFEESDSENPKDDDPEEDGYDPVIGIGVIPVYGALTYKPVAGMCGDVGCSYSSILSDASEMIEDGVTCIVLDCDSGGGEGYGVFECATELRKMCDDAGVKIYAYNDGCMASACYGLACVADEVISNPFAETGSIGVLISLVNDSKALEQEGYTRTFITAGASKVPFAEDGSWREGFLEDLQASVDNLYDSFSQHVSDYTGLSVEAVKGTEAKMFSSAAALELGLVNKVMTRSEFTQYVVSKQGATSA